ncbi:hypothetical protein V5799_018104 [Amblyomma americanum]|uniref:M13 family peptidase n=1 Tax=Amblyomma americanum TaxID=6943 RepID=A0AAQ4F176_AMBAM
MRRFERNRDQVVICDSNACEEYSRCLAESINVSVNPCHNFYRYVCDGWHRSGNGKTVFENLVDAFFDKVSSTLHRSRTTQSGIVQKAAFLLLACEKAGIGATNIFPELRGMLTSAGVTWPLSSPKPDALATVVNIVRTFNVDALLTARPIMSRNRTALKIFPHREFSAIKQRWQTLTAQNMHEVYYLRLYEELSVVECGDRCTVNVSDRYIEHNRTENFIFRELETYNIRSQLTFFHNITEVMKETSCNLLQSLPVIMASAGIPDAKKNLHVYVTNLYYLRTFCQLIYTLGQSVIDDYAGWFTVHTLAPLASSGLAAMYYGTARKDGLAERQCMRLTEQSFGWATYLTYYFQYTTQRTREIELQVIEDIRNAQLELIGQSAWLQTAAGLDENVRGLDVRVGGTTKQRQYIDNAFSRLVVKKDNFGANWLHVAQFVWRLLASTRANTECAFVPASERARLVDYDGARRDAAVAPYAESLPVFHPSLPRAVLYGAFGVSVAHAVLEAFLDAVNERSDIGPAVRRRELCYLDLSALKSGGEHSLAKFLALDAAWAAFAAQAETTDTRLGRLPAFSERQLFFLAHCYLQCGSSPEKAEALCNGPLKNSEAFADAFSCQPDSGMNPEQKCNFYR